MSEQSDAEMLAELGYTAEREAPRTHTAEEERVIAGFEDILNFAEKHGRPPRHGEDGDIFERLYAVRLDRLREQPRFHALLSPLDQGGLLTSGLDDAAVQDLGDEDLLAELGVAAGNPDDITAFRHVSPRGSITPADEVASRAPCADFPTSGRTCVRACAKPESSSATPPSSRASSSCWADSSPTSPPCRRSWRPSTAISTAGCG